MNEPAMSINEQATARVRERLPVLGMPAVLDAVEGARGDAESVYLVGGAVRDLLLGATVTDVDLVVEGDALEFARRMSAQLGGVFRRHEHFQTAVVEGVDGSGQRVEIDIATARTERYPGPGALPVVEPADLAADLARRDFTINAMACSLAANDLGATYTPFDGLRDLDDGIVRVLHENSFRDDPTRLLRAVRYAARFDFEIDPQTRGLIERGVEAGTLGGMDSARVRDELVDLLSERAVIRSLELMESLGIDQALHPRLRSNRRARDLVASIDGTTAGQDQQANPVLVRLAVISDSMTRDELADFMDRLKFEARQRDAVIDAKQRGIRLGDELERSPRLAPSALHAVLNGASAETLRIAESRGERAFQLVEVFRSRLDGLQLEIDGDDLLSAGAVEGPAMGAALSETLALKMDGFVVGRQQELNTARRLLGLSSDSD